MVFTRKGLIGKLFCGHAIPKWCLFAHNTRECQKVYDTFEDCINDVYPDLIGYHRNPTPYEISFGEGTVHYKGFSPIDCVKPNGEVKQWLLCPVEDVRYYR